MLSVPNSHIEEKASGAPSVRSSSCGEGWTSNNLQFDSRQLSSTSTKLPEDVGLDGLFSRQCSEVDAELSAQALELVSEADIEESLQSAILDCKFSVTIGDPRKSDLPLIAVSNGFEEITGYRRDEILGKNCRFLRQGCTLKPETRSRMVESCITGRHFAAIVCNRKKSGEFFWNLVDLRGLVVARHATTGEELWFCVGIQADVTEILENEKKDEAQVDKDLNELLKVSDKVRTRITEKLSMLALMGALYRSDEDATMEIWNAVEPYWRCFEDHVNVEHNVRRTTTTSLQGLLLEVEQQIKHKKAKAQGAVSAAQKEMPSIEGDFELRATSRLFWLPPLLAISATVSMALLVKRQCRI